MAEIILKNICKKYENGRSVVKDFNLNIMDREFIVFVGPSGCGKSTILRMIAGLEEISGGELWIDDQLCNYVEPQKKGMSMVFQNYALYPNMTVYGNLAFALKIRNVPGKEIDAKVRQVAKILEIEHLLKRRPAALSGGQKQRVAIGSAIIRNPKAFLMDEPLSNLDAKLRTQMRVEIAKLHEELQATVIYVTHDQTEAMTLGSRIVVMKEGEAQQADTPERIYHCPANKFVAEFIGSPSMNFFRCRVGLEEGRAVLHIGERSASGSFEYGKSRVYPDMPLSACLAGGYVGQEVIMGIRPEDIYEYEEALSGGFLEASAGIEKRVEAREMLGAEVILHFEGPENGFTTRLKAENQSKVGDSLRLYFDPRKIHVFDKKTERNILLETNETSSVEGERWEEK